MFLETVSVKIVLINRYDKYEKRVIGDGGGGRRRRKRFVPGETLGTRRGLIYASVDYTSSGKLWGLATDIYVYISSALAGLFRSDVDDIIS